MFQVFEQLITNNSIREKFYNIPTINKQIALRQLTYLGKFFRREDSHIPTLLLTVWYEHPRKFRQTILTNKQCMVRNIQQVILNFDAYGALSTWVFHALGAQHWNDLLNTLKHPSFKPPENDLNTPQENQDPLPEQARRPPPPTPPPTPPPRESNVPQSPHHQTSEGLC